VQNSGASSSVTIEYKEFGVRLNFRPEVLGQGRIRLEVAPEVSELSEIGSLRQNGFTVPSVITRRSSTTVELGSGQSFAMAGLLRSKEQGRVSKVPILGDIPVLGVLFRSVRYEEDQTELVVMVTAELVEPLDNGTVRPLPGDLHEAPNDWELFMEGSLAGATKAGKPLERLKALGLAGLRGPGAAMHFDHRGKRAIAPGLKPAGQITFISMAQVLDILHVEFKGFSVCGAHPVSFTHWAKKAVPHPGSGRNLAQIMIPCVTIGALPIDFRIRHLERCLITAGQPVSQHRPASAAKGRSTSVDGPRSIQRRFQLARTGLRGDGALPASACAPCFH
jgi:hypothetical protein